MNEKLIQKWLNNELTQEEFETFKTLDEYASYAKISERAKRFKAPQFDEKASLDKLEFATTSAERTQKKPIYKYIAAIAAVLVIGFTLFKSLDTSSDIQSFETTLAKTEIIALPDYSNVNLNANSSLSYTSSQWAIERKLELKGEALFEVEKGEKFTVNTEYGNVIVLGTVFNVKSRPYIFEVTCFEGTVKVEYNDQSYVLKENDYLVVQESKVALGKNEYDTPDWKNHQSIFKSKPLDIVLQEFKNYYNVELETTNVDTTKKFTGSFSHENLEIALNSITLPLGLSYNIDGETVFLSSK